MRTAQSSIDINRRLKARRIYDQLRRNGITPKHIPRFTDLSWELAAEAAGYKKRPDGHIISKTTISLVRDLFNQYKGKAIPVEMRLVS